MRIRQCRADDLDALEWEGELSRDRAIIRDTFARTQRDTMVMLVAEVDDVIVGQVWIDFARCADAAYVWAVRVRRAWRGRGIASRLLAAAEQLSESRGLAIVELDVEVANKLARGFYERRGYEVLGRDPNTLMIKLRKRLR